MNGRPPGWQVLLACFFASGFAALLYQTAWTREFGAVFGTSELAVATVLAAYMGGLACGAALAGRLAPRLRRPVLVYGLLELAIALAALAVPLAIRAATALEVALLGGRDLPADAGGLASALFYLGCAFAILLAPTTFMGATLPLLARHAVRTDREVGPRIGTLYAVNTAGAIAGTLVCGFALLPALGLRRTVLVGVGVNALVFALAALVARAQPDAPHATPPVPGAAEADPLPHARAILPIILVSGAVSFTYEVLWTRLLGHVLGGSIYAFASMLASVLVGIALGGALGARLATAPRRAARGFAVAQAVTGVASAAAFRALDAVPAFAAWLGAGGRASLATNALLAMAVLVPPALSIGATYPFAVRVLARGPADASPASARVYAWNTVGAIAGSIGAGFFVLPALGYAGTLALAAAVNLALAAGALALAPFAPAFGAIATVAVVLAIARPGEPWELLRTSPLGARATPGDVSYFAVGRAATVLALRRDGEQHLRTNGLPESSIAPRGARFGTELIAPWLTALPAIARPDLRRMLVVGLGGGLAIERLPDPIERVDVVELEPEVVRVNQAFAGWRRRDPLADPRVHVRTNDARSALLLTDARYGAIVSQPSHPWGAGASHLYTREFFALAADRLAPGGVFVQWIGLNFVDRPLLRSLLATLHDVFPNVRVYRPNAGGVLFVASAGPLEIERDAARAIALAPEVYRDVGIALPEDVASALALDERGTLALASGAPVATDDENRLATRSPRVLAKPLGAEGATALFAAVDPLVPPPAGLDPVYLARRVAGGGLPDRARRVADSIADPAQRITARAAVALATRDRAGARTLALQALALDPSTPHAAEIALATGDGDALAAARGGALGPGAAAFARARAAAQASEWNGVAAEDAALAALDPRSPLVPDAAVLRARWRGARGDAALAREGVALLDALGAAFTSDDELRLRAQLSAAAGAPSGALATWCELAARGTLADRRAAVSAAGALLRSAPPGLLGPDEREAWTRDFARIEQNLAAKQRR